MPIQNVAEVQKYLPSRKAVSAVTGVCSFASRPIRVPGTPTARATAYGETFSGRGTSSRRTSPGWTGGSFLTMATRLSMIIHHLDLLRPLLCPPEHDPPLIVDADRVLAGEVPSQSFQSVARRCHKITEPCGIVQLHQLSPSDLGNIGRKPLGNAPLAEDQRRERAPEGHDHGAACSVSCY